MRVCKVRAKFFWVQGKTVISCVFNMIVLDKKWEDKNFRTALWETIPIFVSMTFLSCIQTNSSFYFCIAEKIRKIIFYYHFLHATMIENCHSLLFTSHIQYYVSVKLHISRHCVQVSCSFYLLQSNCNYKGKIRKKKPNNISQLHLLTYKWWREYIWTQGY